MSSNFIRKGGLDKMISSLQSKTNLNLLVNLLVPLGQIVGSLHKMYIKELVERLKPLV